MKKIFALLILLLLTLPLFAANEIQFPYDSGSTIYAIVRRPADSYIWNTAVSPADWRAWVDANIADYDIALTDRSGDFYSNSFPAGITTAGMYPINVYLRAGANPAITDSLIGGGEIAWTGSAEITDYIIWKDLVTMAGRIEDLWLTDSGGFND